MVRYKWYPSFYIIFVADPGVIAKSTTADTAMKFLREIPAINFGPDIVTWPKLVQSLAACTESFPLGSEFLPMSAMTLVAGELGNLINPEDRQMLNLYITLWDGVSTLSKETKGSGNDSVEAPWVNMIGCTTPSWISDSMPAAAVGGGFTSRCLFVYANEKERHIAYVDEHLSDFDGELRDKLQSDLNHIAENLVGPFSISKEARIWGNKWYSTYWDHDVPMINDPFMRNFAARRQTHMHKTAMVISAARSDERIITLADLQLAHQMICDIEPDMLKVFSKIGRTDESLYAERLLDFVKQRQSLPYEEAYRYIHFAFPDFLEFNGIVAGLINSGQIENREQGGVMWMFYTGKDA
jgi:hypothetical protein